MLEMLPILCLFAGLGLLLILAFIDFKTMLLPNIYVAPFALLAILFHWSTDFYYLSPLEIATGGLGGFILLYIIRAAGNKYYGQDSLGLGDVKLLAAAGLWLGLMGVVLSMTIGATVTLIYGLLHALRLKQRTNQPFNISKLAVPAGPGFIIGIIIMGGLQYQDLFVELFYTLFH